MCQFSAALSLYTFINYRRNIVCKRLTGYGVVRCVQLNKLRGLRTYCENETRPVDEPADGRLTFNRRPTQPIGTRKVGYIDCALYREHHEADQDGMRPFRSRGVGDGPRNNGIVGGGSEQQAVGVRSATVQGDVGQHCRDGVRGG